MHGGGHARYASAILFNHPQIVGMGEATVSRKEEMETEMARLRLSQNQFRNGIKDI